MIQIGSKPLPENMRMIFDYPTSPERIYRWSCHFNVFHISFSVFPSDIMIQESLMENITNTNSQSENRKFCFFKGIHNN